jgi:hypothetical protein
LRRLAGVDIFKLDADGRAIEHWHVLKVVGGPKNAVAEFCPERPGCQHKRHVLSFAAGRLPGCDGCPAAVALYGLQSQAQVATRDPMNDRCMFCMIVRQKRKDAYIVSWRCPVPMLLCPANGADMGVGQ